MFAAKFLFRLVKVMNSETSPASLGAAFALGVFLGLVPLTTLQGALALAVVLFLRVNLTATLATFLIAKVSAPLYRGELHALGRRWLEDPGHEELWRRVTHDPVLSFADLGHTITLGGTAVGLAALLPVWALGFLAVRVYRERLEDRIANSRLFRYVRGLKIVTLYRSLTAPLG